MVKRLLLILLFSSLIFGGLFAYKFYQMQTSMDTFQAPPPAVVAVTTVKSIAWPSSLTAVGSLVAVSGVTVTNEIAGIVQRLHFTSGERVKQGQLLVELDSSTDRAELNTLLTEQKLAKIQFNRSQKLINKNYVSKADYDQNKALLAKLNASIQTKKTVIAKKRINAAFLGELGIRKINLGQYLTAGSNIVTLQQVAPIYIDFELPERHLSRVQIGQEVNIIVPAYSNKEFKGQLSTISPLINQNTRSIQIRATIANANRLLRPGMFAEVTLLSDQHKQVLALPDTAISFNPYGSFVFIVNAGDKGFTVQSRLIETGQTRKGWVEIKKGLNNGDQVVSAGQIKLRNGLPIQIDKKPAPGERSIEINP